MSQQSKELQLQSTLVHLVPFALIDGHRQSWLDEFNDAKRVVVLSHCDVNLLVAAKATGWSAVATKYHRESFIQLGACTHKDINHTQLKQFYQRLMC